MCKQSGYVLCRPGHVPAPEPAPILADTDGYAGRDTQQGKVHGLASCVLDIGGPCVVAGIRDNKFSDQLTIFEGGCARSQKKLVNRDLPLPFGACDPHQGIKDEQGTRCVCGGCSIANVTPYGSDVPYLAGTQIPRSIGKGRVMTPYRIIGVNVRMGYTAPQP
ncbi:MAG: hypothetical protein A4E58_00767 [Syntrophorhabdus sp. PtaB.Bin006]|nr:MAG: hypothetical protein A4E58_00767 [Syntrophorhabdus sp. PtaB.Bin006]